MEIRINGIRQKIEKIKNIIQVSKEEIPRFCYTELCRIVGNCRMCLVEVKGIEKLLVGCATQIMGGMEIFTESAKVKKGREGIIEHLLKDHPLDCPICDLGGECGLQEQSRREGSDRSRMYEIRRKVEDKYIGPLIEGIMLRCIQCSRCVRYSVEIGGEGKGGVGMIGRGTGTEIKGEEENNIWNISGNIIDLCPVGSKRTLLRIYIEERLKQLKTEKKFITVFLSVVIRVWMDEYVKTREEKLGRRIDGLVEIETVLLKYYRKEIKRVKKVLKEW